MENLELKLDNKKENKLLKRHELTFTAYYKGETPIKGKIKEEICKLQNLNPSLTVITRIDQQYGVQECNISVNSYNKKEEMMMYEKSVKGEETQKPKEEKPKEEKKEEAKAEKPKQEKKEEKKEAPKEEKK